MNKKTTYITFNEPVNGVYISQVIEVAQQLRQDGLDIEIIAFFSLRDFIKNRKVLKNHFLKSHAIPSIPKLKYWKLNKIWFKILPFFSKNQVVICRGPLATNLAIDNLKNTRIIYDGRGAVWAEQKEYGVYNGSGIENELFEIEKKAVTKSHRQIAVTTELINYWKKNFNVAGDTAKVIPCTLNTTKTGAVHNIPEDLISFIDNANHQNYSITVFAGGNGKWQQLDKICEFAAKVIERQESPVFLFLCPPDNNVQKLQKKFPKRIYNTLVKPDQVHLILAKCDYGIILREQNITNKVASPVKVAEYLFAGLKVIISPNVGDYSKMIKENNLGIIWDKKNEVPGLPKPSVPDKQRNINFAEKHLSKSAVDYGTLIQP
ncbi:glycosyltransferase family protein [Marinilabilia salmonicolor]|uniref:glycosyl transferase n=1 Tax=Marinilabilia salmonicolor TaxID=989 RepID=UPI00029AC077|nr:glycosyl transferase [Marinilabilia salmonicolor]